MNPITPPRQPTRRATILTPSTPSHAFTSPSKVVKSPRQRPHLRTPSLTPRHKKKNLNSLSLGDGFQGTSHTRSLFPPTPSSIGSGRIKDVKLSPVKMKKLSFSYTEQAPIATITPMKIMTEPMTPGGKLITEELKKQLVEDKFSDDSDEETIIKRATLVNPFVSNDKNTSNKLFALNRPKKQLDTIEFVNKKGEKIIKDAGKFDDDDLYDNDDDDDDTLLGRLRLNQRTKHKPVTVYKD